MIKSWFKDTVRRLIKPLVPPLIWRCLRCDFNSKTFEGVYGHVSDVKATSYDSQESLNEVFEYTKEKFSWYQDKRALPTSSPLSPIANLLPLLVSIIGEKKDKVSILDFGGGMGTSYIDCLCSLNSMNENNIDYSVADLEKTIERGRKIFPINFNIDFYDHISSNFKQVDIVYLGSVLQYIPEYKQLIRHLTELAPHYIFLANHFMGKAPTFATMQVNMKRRRMADWVFELRAPLKTQRFFDRSDERS